MAEKSCVVFFITVLLQSVRADIFELLSWTESDTIKPPNISNECIGYGVCNRVSNYPMDLATSLLKQLKTRNITKFTSQNPKAENGDYQSICSFKEEIYYPQAAQDWQGIWYYILNGHSQAFQRFLVERCKKVCPPGPYSTDYTLKCKQSYVYEKMVYLDIEKRKLAIKEFKVPSCCSCTLVK